MSKTNLFNTLQDYIPSDNSIKHTFTSTQPKKEYIECYTDGGCHNTGLHKGVGAWAFYIRDNLSDKYHQASSGHLNTTNNEMELMALCRLLHFLIENKKTELPIKVYIDSRYVVYNINEGNYVNWMYNGWVTGEGLPVKNSKVWEEVIKLYNKFSNIELIHIRGHQGIYGNEKCDQLCTLEIQRLKKL